MKQILVCFGTQNTTWLLMERWNSTRKRSCVKLFTKIVDYLVVYTIKLFEEEEEEEKEDRIILKFDVFI